MRTRFLDPRLNEYAGFVVVVGSALWTILSITLTNEPSNVLAMSGVALALAGLLIIQNGLQMRKVEIETTTDASPR